MLMMIQKEIVSISLSIEKIMYKNCKKCQKLS